MGKKSAHNKRATFSATRCAAATSLLAMCVRQYACVCVPEAADWSTSKAAAERFRKRLVAARSTNAAHVTFFSSISVSKI